MITLMVFHYLTSKLIGPISACTPLDLLASSNFYSPKNALLSVYNDTLVRKELSTCNHNAAELFMSTTLTSFAPYLRVQGNRSFTLLPAQEEKKSSHRDYSSNGNEPE